MQEEGHVAQRDTVGADQEGDESLGGIGGILYFSRELVVCLGGIK